MVVGQLMYLLVCDTIQSNGNWTAFSPSWELVVEGSSRFFVGK